jgi:hypothetical protein
MKYYEVELDGELIRLRLTSGDCITLEEKTKLPILKYIQQTSITTIATLLMYMRRSDVPNFSMKDASALYDKFIDNGYTMERVVYDVIYEGLVVSGFLSKEQLEEIKKEVAEAKEQIKTTTKAQITQE